MSVYNVSHSSCPWCNNVLLHIAPRGTLVSCSHCGMIYTQPIGRLVPWCILYVPGKISDDPPKSNENPRWKSRPLVWQRGGEEDVYFPCSLCGHVLKVKEDDISPEDVVWQFVSAADTRYPCVRCTHCGAHTWGYFQGFTESRKDMIKENS